MANVEQSSAATKLPRWRSEARRDEGGGLLRDLLDEHVCFAIDEAMSAPMPSRLAPLRELGVGSERSEKGPTTRRPKRRAAAS